MKRIKQWWASRKVVRNSEISVYASRKTTFPLEDCTSENLIVAAAYNRRQASKYRRNTDRMNHVASAGWNDLAADALEKLSEKLKDGQTVGELPFRKRKREVNRLIAITKGKAA